MDSGAAVTIVFSCVPRESPPSPGLNEYFNAIVIQMALVKSQYKTNQIYVKKKVWRGDRKEWEGDGRELVCMFDSKHVWNC